jgi:hypothetical protein
LSILHWAPWRLVEVSRHAIQIALLASQSQLAAETKKITDRNYKFIWWRCSNSHIEKAVGYVVKRFLSGKSVCRACLQANEF